MFEKMMKQELAWKEFCEWIKHNSSFNFNEIIQEFQYGFEYSVDERDFKIILLLMLFFFDKKDICILFNRYEILVYYQNKNKGYISIPFDGNSREEALKKACEKVFEIYNKQLEVKNVKSK